MILGRKIVALSMSLVASTACSHARVEPPAPANPFDARARFTGDGGEAMLRVRVARTDAEKERGLMHVTSLPPDAGMAFVWDEPTRSSFWMKDTLIPLSIAFVDDAGRVTSIRDMQPCRADPCPLYSASGPFVVAVEANRGWFARRGVEVGDRFSLGLPA